jgi:hypothetical protein
MVPCGMFSRDRRELGEWPTMYGAPIDSGFVWQDTDGDGGMSPSEFAVIRGPNAATLDGVWGTWVDDAGGLWVASEDHFLLGEAATESVSRGCFEGRVLVFLASLLQHGSLFRAYHLLAACVTTSGACTGAVSPSHS